MSDCLPCGTEEWSFMLDCEDTIDPILLGADVLDPNLEDQDPPGGPVNSCMQPEFDWLACWAESMPPTNQLNESGLCINHDDTVPRTNASHVQADTSSPPNHYKRKNQSLACTFPGCNHKGTFRRQWELQRHQSSKHKYGQVDTFTCEARGCFKKGSSKWTFARPDKLTSHIRASHKRETIFDRCPFGSCAVSACSLEMMGLHIRRFHGTRSHQGRAVTNAALGSFRKCPWWRCGKHIAFDRFLDHVRAHNVDEQQMAMSSCHAEGLSIDFTQSCPVLSVMCPLCEIAFESFEHFKEHFWTIHLFSESSGGSEHFTKWKSEWANHVPKTARAEIKNLAPWQRLDSLEVYGTERDLKCPACPFAVTKFGKGSDLVAKKSQAASHLRALRSHYEITKDHTITVHHLSLLRDEDEVIAELYPYRMQLLRLYPALVTHPVFGDLD